VDRTCAGHDGWVLLRGRQGIGIGRTVHKATDINLKRAVAIKVLPTSVAADSAILGRASSVGASRLTLLACVPGSSVLDARMPCRAFNALIETLHDDCRDASVSLGEGFGSL
jgi:hypothetical protein